MTFLWCCCVAFNWVGMGFINLSLLACLAAALQRHNYLAPRHQLTQDSGEENSCPGNQRERLITLAYLNHGYSRENSSHRRQVHKDSSRRSGLQAHSYPTLCVRATKRVLWLPYRQTASCDQGIARHVLLDEHPHQLC